MSDSNPQSTPEPEPSTAAPTRRCPVCGEHVPKGARECGICGTPFGLPPASTFAIVITLVVICIATLVIAPPIGVLLTLGSIAPVIRLTMVVRKRSERGLDTPRWQQWAMYLSSLWVTSVVLWTTFLAAFFAFFFGCLGIGVATHAVGPAIGGGLLAAIAVVVLLGRSFTGWVRGRWKRDVGETEDESPPTTDE